MGQKAPPRFGGPNQSTVRGLERGANISKIIRSKHQQDLVTEDEPQISSGGMVVIIHQAKYRSGEFREKMKLLLVMFNEVHLWASNKRHPLVTQIRRS